MQIVSNLHEMSEPVFWKTKKNNNLMSAEFAQIRVIKFKFLAQNVSYGLNRFRMSVLLYHNAFHWSVSNSIWLASRSIGIKIKSVLLASFLKHQSF